MARGAHALSSAAREALDADERVADARRPLRWAAWVGGAALCLRIAGGYAPDTVELVYARGLYPHIAAAQLGLAGRTWVGVAELIAAALLLVFARGCVRVLRRRARLGVSLARLALSLAVLWLSFLLLWGLNYQRPPLLELTVWPEPVRGADALAELCAERIAAANELRVGLRESADGQVDLGRTKDEQLARMQLGFASLPGLPDELARELARTTVGPKTPLIARHFSWVGITGIFVPFTGEPCLNPELPVVDMLFAAAHELAHARGVAHEDEANFIAWLACCAHPDEVVRYAGELAAVRYSMNALFRVDATRGLALLDELSEPVRGDWEGAMDYWMQHQGPVLDVAEEVNDTYLRAQGEEQGVESYGSMVDLLLAARVALAR